MTGRFFSRPVAEGAQWGEDAQGQPTEEGLRDFKGRSWSFGLNGARRR